MIPILLKIHRNVYSNTTLCIKVGTVQLVFFTRNVFANNMILKRLNGFFDDINVAILQRKYIAHFGILCLTSA